MGILTKAFKDHYEPMVKELTKTPNPMLSRVKRGRDITMPFLVFVGLFAKWYDPKKHLDIKAAMDKELEKIRNKRNG